MMTAVCDLFFAPKGIASGGGHGSSVSTFEVSAVDGSAGGGAEAGCFERSAGFSSVLGLGTGAVWCVC
jgi:hypothetical protein